MAKVKIQGHASGTGILTVTAPNTSTDRTITLPDGTGTLIADDGSGNVLVGTTVNNPYTSNVNGVSIRPSNTSMQISKDGNASLLLNRKSSDGQIVQLGKDGSAIGSIGVTSSDQLYIARTTGSQGIKFKNSATMPCSSSGNDADNAQDLGSSSVRWKDLYLSGNVVIGTNGKGIDFSANADSSATGASTTAELLDDYEEGSWTPKLNINNNTTGISYNEQTGVYTKIGRMVYCSCRITLSDKGSLSGDLSVQGLPFPLANLGGCYGVGAMGFGTNFNGSTFGQHNHIFTADPNGTTIYMRYIQDSGNWNGLTNSMIQNDSDWVLGFTYQSA